MYYAVYTDTTEYCTVYVYYGLSGRIVDIVIREMSR